MVRVETIIYTQKFESDVKRVKDRLTRERLEKQLRRIVENPEIGKPPRYGLKFERTVRVNPYRLIYAISGNSLILLRFEHRKSVYD